MSTELDSTEGSGIGRWITRLIILTIVLGGVGAGVYYLPDTLLSKEVVENLTFTVAKGPIKIAVTEQGTLESSENT